MNPLDEAREAAKTVWQDLKTIDPQPGDEERIDAILDAHTAALAALGRLRTDETAPTPEELDELALWLARQSGFYRYWDENLETGTLRHDGWKELRQHPRHVEIAYAKALKHAPPGDTDHLLNLRAARSLLLSATDHTAGSA